MGVSMKFPLKSVALGLFVSLSLGSQAGGVKMQLADGNQVSCAAKEVHVEKVGDLYQASAEISCELAEARYDAGALKDAYSSEADQHEVSHRQDSEDSVEMTVTRQVPASGYPDMTVRFDREIMVHGNGAFTCMSKSNKIIKAPSKTKYTKSIVEQVVASPSKRDGTTVTVRKQVKIEKPWGAPSGIFKSAVKKNVRKDMADLTQRHVQFVQENL